MREYLNAAERSRVLIAMCAKVSMNDFRQSTALTDEEKECLEEACLWIEAFQDSIFKRLGEGFTKAMRNLATENTIRVVGKWGESPDMSATIDTQELEKIMNECGNSCLFCERTEHKTCPVFQIKQYLGIEGFPIEGCPYKLGGDL